MQGESKSGELAFRLCLKWEPPLDETDEAPRCVCHHWATGGSAGDGHDVGEEASDGDALGVVEWFGVTSFLGIVSTLHAS